MQKDIFVRTFKHPPVLQTPRLRMRQMLPDDDRDMYAYASSSEVTRYLTWEPHRDLAYTRRYLQFVQKMYRKGAFFDWALVLRETDKMIGTCGFTCYDEGNNSAEIGYVINQAYWGNAYAAEAVHATLAFGFQRLSLHRIEAHFIAGNDRSRRVMEKCGMTFEGMRRSAMLIKGVYRTIGVCAILRDEFDPAAFPCAFS